MCAEFVEKWTDEDIAVLTKGLEEGKSGSQLAEMLGRRYTRNAVIGKVHRLGLSKRRPSKPAAKPKLKPDPELKRALAKPLAPRKPRKAFIWKDGGVPPKPKRIRLLKLKPRSCRWPVDGEGEKMLFCGWASEPDSHLPYCAYHHSKAVVAPRPRGAPPVAWKQPQGVR